MPYNLLVADTLLQTKLFIPPKRPETVPRPRLIRRLDEGLASSHTLTLFSAPAGYGKTTIVVDWLRKENLLPAWVSVDLHDNEPVRFFSYLFSAIQTVNLALGKQLSEILETSQQLSPISLITALINEVADISSQSPIPSPQPLILVLDDYHAINEPSIHESLDYLLERPSPGLHVVILTRQDPPLALSRLRGRGLLTEIRQDELRFSLEESAQFLEESMGLNSFVGEAPSLFERTEGWIAGLQLAALSMRGLDPAERHRFISDFSGRHHFILDYLTDEVLDRQPASTLTFLLYTSVLDQMCGSLCDTLLSSDDRGSRHSQDLLKELEASNLFVIPLDNERTWYRYHHLFRELLLARLDEGQPEIVPTLHHRAAAWYEEAGHIALAVQHELLSRDMERAADLISRALKQFATWTKVEVKTFLQWLQALPEDVLVNRPWLRLFASRGLYVTGQPTRAAHDMDTLETWLIANQDIPEGKQLLGAVQADRASYAVVQGEPQMGIDYARQALTSLAEEDLNGRMRAFAILGLAYSRKGDAAQAEEAFSRAIEISTGTEMAFAAVPLICNRAETKIVQGRLEEALQDCDFALRLAAVDGRTIAAAGFARLEQGKIYYEQDFLQEAEENLQEALELLSKGGITESFGSVHAYLALVRQARGYPDEALDLAKKAVNVAEAVGIERITNFTRAFLARIWLAQASIGQAVLWAEGYSRLPPVNYIRDFEELTLAQILIASDRTSKAVDLIEPLCLQAEQNDRVHTIIHLKVLKALAFEAQGDQEGALTLLQEALELGEPNGYRRVFLEQGPSMARLLSRAALRNIAPEYTASLLASFETDPVLSRLDKKGPVEKIQSRPSILVDPLSPREQEVLLLLADGLSNKEIAQRLFLSAHTIRSHTYNLYSKLGVHSRTQAIARARELGLLNSR